VSKYYKVQYGEGRFSVDTFKTIAEAETYINAVRDEERTGFDERYNEFYKNITYYILEFTSSFKIAKTVKPTQLMRVNHSEPVGALSKLNKAKFTVEFSTAQIKGMKKYLREVCDIDKPSKADIQARLIDSLSESYGNLYK
tara:strand:+ start:1354 stop:1776 length:423 start_codon:yes stop_codon:yes gene_type:complete